MIISTTFTNEAKIPLLKSIKLMVSANFSEKSKFLTIVPALRN